MPKIFRIHALREEGDQHTRTSTGAGTFIHASGEEGDPKQPRLSKKSRHFYPRPPREGDYWYKSRLCLWAKFHPRPPREATAKRRKHLRFLLLHYKTILHRFGRACPKHPKTARICTQNGLKTWCEGRAEKAEVFSHSAPEGRGQKISTSPDSNRDEPDALDLGLIVVAQLIKPQTVQIGVDESGKLGLQNSKLRGVQQAPKTDRTAVVVHALFWRLAQAFVSAAVW